VFLFSHRAKPKPFLQPLCCTAVEAAPHRAVLAAPGPGSVLGQSAVLCKVLGFGMLGIIKYAFGQGKADDVSVIKVFI